MTESKTILKRMGVMNITPNSFSDGSELKTSEELLTRLHGFGAIDCLDIGAESTAPMNASISAQEEWSRLSPYLSLFKAYEGNLSFDTYHPETVLELSHWLKKPFIWNDVSGKFDQHVERFLSFHAKNQYVFCHNLAPKRELSGKHMNYLSEKKDGEFLEELARYFRPHRHPQVIFDPTLGFSKTYEQNWWIMEHFGELQNKVGHESWLLGFSRKSFLRKKYGIEKITPETKEKLDQIHSELLKEIVPTLSGVVWIRTHRPELI